MRAPLAGYGGITRRASEEGADSIWGALQAAADGPAFQPRSLDDFPYAFELETRDDPSATDELLHMVVGRTMLGLVRGVSRIPLAATEAAGAGSGAAAADATEPDAARSSDADGSSDPISLLGRLRGALFSRSSAERQSAADASSGSRPVAFQSNASTGGGAPRPFHRLEFEYQGRVLASAEAHGRRYGSSVSAGSGLQLWPSDDFGGSSGGGAVAGSDAPSEPTAPASSVGGYITVYRHNADGSKGAPLAHILSPAGYAGINVRSIVACDLVNPYLSGDDATGDTSEASAGGPAPPTWASLWTSLFQSGVVTTSEYCRMRSAAPRLRACARSDF